MENGTHGASLTAPPARGASDPPAAPDASAEPDASDEPDALDEPDASDEPVDAGDAAALGFAGALGTTPDAWTDALSPHHAESRELAALAPAWSWTAGIEAP